MNNWECLLGLKFLVQAFVNFFTTTFKRFLKGCLPPPPPTLNNNNKKKKRISTLHFMATYYKTDTFQVKLPITLRPLIMQKSVISSRLMFPFRKVHAFTSYRIFSKCQDTHISDSQLNLHFGTLSRKAHDCKRD